MTKGGILITLGLVIAFASLPCSGIMAQSMRHDSLDHKSGYDRQKIRIFSPKAAPNQLEADDRLTLPHIRFPKMDTLLDPYFAFKKRLEDRHGFAFGTDYSMLLQTSTNAINEVSPSKTWVVYPGQESYPIKKDIWTLPVSQLQRIFE